MIKKKIGYLKCRVEISEYLHLISTHVLILWACRVEDHFSTSFHQKWATDGLISCWLLMFLAFLMGLLIGQWTSLLFSKLLIMKQNRHTVACEGVGIGVCGRVVLCLLATFRHGWLWLLVRTVLILKLMKEWDKMKKIESYHTGSLAFFFLLFFKAKCGTVEIV